MEFITFSHVAMDVYLICHTPPNNKSHLIIRNSTMSSGNCFEQASAVPPNKKRCIIPLRLQVSIMGTAKRRSWEL
jgi:hypothetical protein